MSPKPGRSTYSLTCRRRRRCPNEILFLLLLQLLIRPSQGRGYRASPLARPSCLRCECRARKTGGRGGKCVICMRMGRNDNAPAGSGKGGAKEDIWFSDGRISLSSSDVLVNCPSPLLCPANPAISRFAPLHVVIRVNRSIWFLLLRHACQSVRRTVMYRTQGKCFLRPMCTQLGCLHACDFSSFVQECCAKLCKKKGR